MLLFAGLTWLLSFIMITLIVGQNLSGEITIIVSSPVTMLLGAFWGLRLIRNIRKNKNKSDTQIENASSA